MEWLRSRLTIAGRQGPIPPSADLRYSETSIDACDSVGKRMFRIPVFVLFVAMCGLSAGLANADVSEFPEPKDCPDVYGLQLGPEEAQTWNACDKWAWDCIARGREANFFAKECVEPRSDTAKGLQEKFKYAPFFNPGKFKDANGLSTRFVYTVLTKKEYAAALTAAGIRLVGAYFADTVNLENITTDKNLVFDQSIFKSGLRLTNFRSDRNVSLDGANVRGSIYLKRANIGGTLFLEDGVFDLLDAADARFAGSIDGPSAIFNAPIHLDRVKVEGKVSLIRARLTELTTFDTTIGSKLEMRFAHVRGRIDLTGTTINGDLRLQRLQFGRALTNNPRLSCDWDLYDASNRFFLSPSQPDFVGRPETYAAIIDEVVNSRPSNGLPDYPCLKLKDQTTGATLAQQNIQHEVLLRDMKIGGALCLLDLTGEIAGSSSGPGTQSANLATISLDGSEARTTILRWTKTTSDTLWQAVHFKTRNLYFDLGTPPNRYFLDNLELENISFLKPLPPESEAQEQREDSRSFLCDAPSGPDARYASDSPQTHQRIVDFFNSDANQSKSAQPFAEIVKRLDGSGNASTKLKVAFSDYKFRALCQSSDFFKRMEKEGAGSVLEAPNVMFRVAGNLMAQTKTDRLDEARRIGLDIACRPMLAAYKYTVSYGYEPLNILYLIIIFILLFWALLRLDEPNYATPEGRPPRLGLLYAIDMFNPFTQIRINRAHGAWTPQTRWLRMYLAFHRFVGFVLCILLAVGFYGAGRGVSP